MKRPDSNHQITAIILSGGAGRRFDGADKGLVRLHGKHMIEWVIDAVRPQVDRLVISIHRNRGEYETFGWPLVVDHSKNEFEGPLAGIVAVLRAQDKRYATRYLICSCDSPQLPSDHVRKLTAALETSGADVAVVHDGERQQHLHCLIECAATDSLLTYFNQGNRSMHGWLEQVQTTQVDFSTQAERFSNINSPDELA